MLVAHDDDIETNDPGQNVGTSQSHAEGEGSSECPFVVIVVIIERVRHADSVPDESPCLKEWRLCGT